MNEHAKDKSDESCCGHGHNRCCCCVGKLLGALLLVLLGVVGGYFLGRCHGGKHMCAAPMTATTAPAPAK